MDTSLTYYLVIQVKTLSFVKLVILSNSYASQIWTKLYFHHKIRKYEVILRIIMLKHIFYFRFRWKKTSRIKKIQEIVINIQTNATNLKIIILEKFRKKETSNLEFL